MEALAGGVEALLYCECHRNAALVEVMTIMITHTQIYTNSWSLLYYDTTMPRREIIEMAKAFVSIFIIFIISVKKNFKISIKIKLYCTHLFEKKYHYADHGLSFRTIPPQERRRRRTQSPSLLQEGVS